MSGPWFEAGTLLLSLTSLALVLSFCGCLFAIFPKLSALQWSLKCDDEQDHEGLYRDEDGVAAEGSSKATKSSWAAGWAVVMSIAGAIAALAAAIDELLIEQIATTAIVECWMLFTIWVLLLILSFKIAAEYQYKLRFFYGIASAPGFLTLAVSASIQVYWTTYQPEVILGEDKGLLLLVFNIVQLIVSIIAFLASLSIPRRPSLLHEGHPVDDLHSGSALQKWVLHSATSILATARSKKDLEIDDLPFLDREVRSGFLLEDSNLKELAQPLWRALFSEYWRTWLFQSFYSSLQSILTFAPQLSLYAILRALEHKSSSDAVELSTGLLILAFGASIIGAAWTEAWNYWIGYSDLASKVRSELSALIFAKAGKRKDAKGHKKASGSGSSSITSKIEDESSRSPSGQDISVDDEAEKSRQSTINLVSVDAKRIAQFLMFHFLFIQTATRLAVSMAFLARLLHWQPLLAGFAGFLVILPVNIWASKRFTDSQTKLMHIRDQKLMVLTEALQGIRQIKFSAQESQWQSRIETVRQAELDMQWRVFCYDTILICCWLLGPITLSAVSLTVYAFIFDELTASVAFTAIALFSTLEFTLAIIPEFTADGLEAWVSLQRIEAFLKSPERSEYITPDSRISFEKASITWPSDDVEGLQNNFKLESLDFSVTQGELTVICGPTGSGKSLLLASLVGEGELITGALRAPSQSLTDKGFDPSTNQSNWVIPSAMAYVAQIPWIENATIRDNILFGLPYDERRYEKVIEDCALKPDFVILTDGDMTDIGFNGINLSGGQKWRISFARALYSRAGILILDDLFSAVDAHVAQHLLEKALTGELSKDRTRILVTHHVGLVASKARCIIALRDGSIEHIGSPKDLSKQGVLDEILNHGPEKKDKVTSHDEPSLATHDDKNLTKIRSTASHVSDLIDESSGVAPLPDKPKQFTTVESKERGSVKLNIYRQYFKRSGGLIYWIPVVALFIAHQCLVLDRSWVIGAWTRSYARESVNNELMASDYSPVMQSLLGQQSHNSNVTYYLGLYLGLSFVLSITGTIRYFFVYTRSIRASREFFQAMIYAVLRAPLRWLDTVPVGRILNRFTSDFESIDSRLGMDSGMLMYNIVQLLGIVVAGIFVSPWMLLIAVLLFFVCAWMTAWYLAGARQVKRLESVAKSPIFELFGSTLTGLGTIRAYNRMSTYQDRMLARIDTHARTFWYVWMFSRWVAMRLNLIGAMFSTGVAIVVVYSKAIDASLAGFALSFAMQYSLSIVWATRFYANVELAMNSVERVSEYSNITIEDQGDDLPEVPASWPSEGRLEVHDLVAAYDRSLPPVLKGLSFKVDRNERVGVVGRTGAGKSSLTLALFRFLEASAGAIVIDGLNVAQIPLHVLRGRIAIIPQDPVLFSGTIRSNLDPFDVCDDTELIDALARVQLTKGTQNSSNKSAPFTLDTPVSESGLNLSQGQRQLLCLARAIVRRPKLLVLDEATSAVDMATDQLIQRSIRREFANATLLVIAHRLSTVADFEKVLVMDDGRAAEFGSPRDLLLRRDGVFKSMVERSGEGERLKGVILGDDKDES